MNKKKPQTIPSYTFEDTSDENIKRFVDRYGDWTHYWLVKEQKFVKAVNHILNLGYNKGPRFAEYLLSVTKEESKKRLESAGEEGSRTHAAIRDLISGVRVTLNSKYMNELTGRMDILSPDEWDNLVAFKAWCDKYQPQLVGHEFAVASLMAGYGYAGTADALFVITVPSGDKVFDKPWWGSQVLILIDWKTSSGIRAEYKAQLAAYWHAMIESGKFKKFIERFRGNSFSGIVRIGTKHKSGYEFEVWDEAQTSITNFSLFMSAEKIAHAYEGEFNPTIEQAPIQFRIKIPKAKAPKKSNIKNEVNQETTI